MPENCNGVKVIKLCLKLIFSAPIPARRFPDQDSIPFEDYKYFSDLDINGVIKGGVVIGAMYVITRFGYRGLKLNIIWGGIIRNAIKSLVNGNVPAKPKYAALSKRIISVLKA